MRIPKDVLKIRESILYNEYAVEDFSIASVGDIHISKKVGMDDVNHISEALYQVKPNYICFLGDLVDSPEELTKDVKVQELETLMKNSASIAPTMVILGNHDFVDESLEGFPDVIEKTQVWDEIAVMPNVYLLNDDAYRDHTVFIGGYRQKKDVYYHFYKERCEDSYLFREDFEKQDILTELLPEALPRILLTHSPECIHNLDVEAILWDYDAIITGHYHNGCVPAILDDIYPKNAGLITPGKRPFPKYARGIRKLETGTYLIYNGGWVKIQDCSPKILQPLDAFFNRQMDVTTFTSDPEYKQEQVNNKKLVLK